MRIKVLTAFLYLQKECSNSAIYTEQALLTAPEKLPDSTICLTGPDELWDMPPLHHLK